jgi:dienelactone hydrolase
MSFLYFKQIITLGCVGVMAVPCEAQVRDLLRENPDRVIHRAKDWEGRRKEILAAMQRVMGPLPGKEKRSPLEVRIEKEEQTESFLRRKLTFQSAPGERVPAWLLIPKDLKAKAAAMLVLHQTTARGKDEAVGLTGNLNLHLGKELAERGYVVLAPDYPTLGEYDIDVYAHGWESGSMKAVWDNVRALDLLQSLKEVDGKRIGVIGHSLGGHNGLFTAAFDSRIRCVVTNCGFTSFARYYGGNLAGWSGPRYMPRIKLGYATPDRMPFDFHDVLGAIAPRPVYVSAPVRDSNFDVTGVRDVVSSVNPIYDFLGASGGLTAVYPDCEHDWPTPDRMKAYDWIDRQLKAH